jgi:arylsulfatase A-like enzyme
VPVCSIFERPADHDEWLRLYRDQVVFVNDRVLQLIDAMRSVGADPVIVLMSDHGSRAFQPENQEEMLLNFFAAHSPGAPGLFPSDATPINIFPRLFGAYLDEEIPLIPDRFFLPDGDGPLQIKAIE